MNAKIRDAQLQKIPYMLVVGEREAAEGKVAVLCSRRRQITPLAVGKGKVLRIR